MALVKLQLGGELDIATADELSAMGDKIVGCLPGQQEPPLPVPLTLADSANAVVPPAGSSVVATLRFPPPPVGRMYTLVALTLTGTDDRTAPPSNVIAAVYIGRYDNPSLGMLVEGAISPLPKTFYYPRKSLRVHQGDTPFVLFYGGTVGQPLSATLRVLSWRNGDIEASAF